MKQKLLSVILVATCALGLNSESEASVTLNFANYTGSGNGPNGLPVVDAAGAAILNSTNSVFASLGYLTAGEPITPQNVLARFNPIGNTQVPAVISGGLPRNSLINGVNYSNSANALPAGFSGQNVVVLIGNNATASLSTAIALFNFGVNFGTPDPVAGLVQNFALTSASVPQLGTLRSVTTQPLNQTNTFAQGVMLVPIPEPSALLLGAFGALGILRRRRI